MEDYKKAQYFLAKIYSLSFNKFWKEEPSEYIPKFAFRMQIDSGYSEECLKVID